MQKKYPAPWQLSGYGYAAIYQLKRSFVVRHTPDFLKGKFDGGLGAIILTNYLEADCGPYSELLFIPGVFNYQNEPYRHISKIYVSTKTSMENGKENWGIEKELAKFTWNTYPSGGEELIVEKDDKQIARLKFKMKKLSFPVSARWIKTPLIQKKGDDLLKIRLRGLGRGRHAELIAIEVDEEYFPDVNDIQPIASAKIESFTLKFPRARKIKEMKMIEETKAKRRGLFKKKAIENPS